MKVDFLSRYTPRLMSAEVLEAIFVQRQELAHNLIECIRDGILTSARHHTLLTGARGIGKTHLVSLVYHRIRDMKDLHEQILIAWLSEEEWSVTSFLDLLLCVFQALQEESKNSKGAQPCPPTEGVESLYSLPIEDAESDGAALLKEFIGDRTLLLLVENLDDLFSGLGKDGQKQLCTFLKENNCIILATAQSYFKDVKQKNAPFYGFFRHEELKDLNTSEATQLLANIAKLKGNSELESFIQTSTGRDRIKAVHFLAGGNHRLYVIFSEFLTHQESLDQLVDAFMRTLDDLTPYYQERMRFLSPQQRKIVDFLCDRGHAVTVKEIAQRCFMTHQTASSQLKKLLEISYLRSEPYGRESFYELREPLMRFCLKAKKQKGEPIQLIVDFLRRWYTKTELQQQLGLENAEITDEWVFDDLAKQSNASLERQYLLCALQVIEEDDKDPRVAACWKEIEDSVEKEDFVSALQQAEKLIDIRGYAEDWLVRGIVLDSLHYYEEALASSDKVIELDPNDVWAWKIRGSGLNSLNRYEEALTSSDKAIELDPNDIWAWDLRGSLLRNLNRYEEALTSYGKVIELDPNLAQAWKNRGNVLYILNRYEEALTNYNKAIELDLDLAEAWRNRGNVLYILKRYEEALTNYNKAIELDLDLAGVWVIRGVVLYSLNRYEEALTSYDKAIELDLDLAGVWVIRGVVLYSLNRYEEALTSYDKAIELDPNLAQAWRNRGVVLCILNRYEEALTSYDKAIELDPNLAQAWRNRGVVLCILNRYEEALTSYDKAIELDPNLAQAWRNRGVVLCILNRYEEALTNSDKAIELDPNDIWAWNLRGNVMCNLGCYGEALTNYDKVIELDPNDIWAWDSRGGVLCILGRHKEALVFFDKALSLGKQSSSIFFVGAISLLALNRWDEGIATLDKALNNLTEGEELSANDTDLIICYLFNNTQYAAMWKSRLTTLIALYDKHRVIPALGKGLVRNIPMLMSEMVSDKARQTWLEVWQELTSHISEFQLPLRLLNAAVRYRETKGDKRVLLQLPIEERNLLKPLLRIDQP